MMINPKPKSSVSNKYIHYIRNMRTLDIEMMQNISNMSETHKMEIIIVCNDMITWCAEFIRQHM